MLRYKIKSPTGKTLQVTEFAYEKRYKGLGWEIVDTTGKAMGSAKEISVPLPQQQGFVPPQVLALHQKLPESVAVANDPTGPSEVPEPTVNPEPEAPKVEHAKPAKKIGRPKKAK